MWVFLALLAWPLIEIGLFVEIGGRIGLWPTLAWVIGTGVAGVLILRVQAAAGAVTLRRGFSTRLDPLSPLAMGVLAGLAGVLLFLPGFLTDAAGLVLLLPPVRAALVARAAARMRARAGGGWADRARGPVVLEGEWTEVMPDEGGAPEGGKLPPGAPPPRGRSGWTRP